MRSKPFVLLILDGWGYRPEAQDNAIAQAASPAWDLLWAHSPHTLLDPSGAAVGLPEGQIGNSEVGHMNLGAGRTVYQNLTRINKAIDDGTFQENPALLNAITQAVERQRAIHLLGLVSPGGVHSHESHLHTMIDLCHAKGVKTIYVHAILDGRDVLPQSAADSIKALSEHLSKVNGEIVSVMGRYYAMDRDNRWDRVELAYQLIVNQTATHQAEDALSALKMAYARGETDEFVQPTRIGQTACPLTAEDSMVFMNFRADRARQLSHALTTPSFDGFERKHCPKFSTFVTLTEYDNTLSHVAVAFPPVTYANSLGEYLSKLGLTQLRVSETEKYAHVTFFFNCGIETPHVGEDRILIPSPKVATYDLKPEMSAPEVTAALVKAITDKQHDLIICNIANPDMVGHTGQFDAACKAVEVVDDALSKIIDALRKAGGEALITADHGNIEHMRDRETNQPHTAHTLSKVPLVYVGKQAIQFKAEGTLADVAPTILQLLELAQPKEMTGQSLIT